MTKRSLRPSRQIKQRHTKVKIIVTSHTTGVIINNRRNFQNASATVNNVEVNHDDIANVNLIENQVSNKNNDPLDKYIFCITDSSKEAKNQIMGTLGGIKIKWIIDTGSMYNIMDIDSWKWLKANKFDFIHMAKQDDNDFSAFGEYPLHVIGVVHANLQIGQRTKPIKFYVVEQKGQPLLGFHTCEEFGIVKIMKPIEPKTIAAVTCNTRFSTIKGIQVELPIDPDVPPVAQPYRRIPIQLEAAVDKKLDELLDAGIIEYVSGHSSWVSPMVIVTKDKGSETPEVRICNGKSCHSS